MTTTSVMLEAARAYRLLGLSIFPVRPRDKHPLIPWKPYQAELAHPDQLEAWWGDQYPDANIGCATGAVSNIVVLDADGAEGLASLVGLDTPATTWLSKTANTRASSSISSRPSA